jgi:acetyl-CoA acetyltransferase
MACEAIVLAADDAGLSVSDIDGFALYSLTLDPAILAETLGIPEIRFSATLTGGGGGSAGGVGLAATATAAGIADVVVTLMTLQQADRRLGASFEHSANHDSSFDFVSPSGMLAPGQMFAMLAMRHMHQYGTRREHFAEVAVAQRANAVRRSTALLREPLSINDYFSAPMLSDPLCRFDFCLESDGAVACITVSADRAADLRQPPVHVLAHAHGGAGGWGKAFQRMQMPDDYFASSGHRPVAQRLFEQADVEPSDIDVAELYDHYSPAVIMQLEDYGFCGIGEGGPFVGEGHIRWPGGSLPVNTHGGNLSEAYVIGMTHVVEAVEQLRGTAVNQVADASLALVTGGPAALPTSGLILGSTR